MEEISEKKNQTTPTFWRNKATESNCNKVTIKQIAFGSINACKGQRSLKLCFSRQKYQW